MGSKSIIVFTRYPVAGTTKTRLIPAIGEDGAAELQRRMTEHVMECARAAADRTGAAIEVRYEGGTHTDVQEWLGDDLVLKPQGSGHLGQRMAHAFAERILSGDDRVVLVGTDCPGLTAEILEDALEQLKQRDIVFGPASDGGYYLLGLSRGTPDLFEDIDWGTRHVLKQSLRVARVMDWSVGTVAKLNDMDEPEDLPLLPDKFKPIPNLAPLKISVVIPTLNEVQNIGLTIERAQQGAHVEIIVVDGGSDDPTIDIATSYGAKIIQPGRGRAKQLNAGAEAATGAILLFLHADTLLPAHYDDYIRIALTDKRTMVGAFAFKVEGDSAGLRFIERLVNWRSRSMHMPYGDQALFLRKDIFEGIGGYPDQPIMEDYELVRRLRRNGRVVTMRAAVVTSGRRWEKLGVIRTTLINQIVIAGYLLGVSPQKLARLYRGGKGGLNGQEEHPTPNIQH